jgi:large subunit ribosomal protein L25
VEVLDHGHPDQVVVTILSPQVKDADTAEDEEGAVAVGGEGAAEE